MVKCSECGYLSFRNHETRRLDEVEERIRQRFPFPAKPDLSRPIHESVPICFVDAHDLREEVESVYLEQGMNPAEALKISRAPGGEALKVIQKTRSCEPYVKWRIGSSPKEHQEMIDRKWMIEREDSRDAAMRAREDKRDRDAQDREGRRDTEANMWRKINFVQAIILGVATVVVVLVAASISRN